MDFTFSDTIAGYVADVDASQRAFGLRTSDGRQHTVHLTDTTYAEVLPGEERTQIAPRDLDEPPLPPPRARRILPANDGPTEGLTLTRHALLERAWEPPRWSERWRSTGAPCWRAVPRSGRSRSGKGACRRI